jgi:hypothetical protein
MAPFPDSHILSFLDPDSRHKADVTTGAGFFETPPDPPEDKRGDFETDKREYLLNP